MVEQSTHLSLKGKVSWVSSLNGLESTQLLFRHAPINASESKPEISYIVTLPLWSNSLNQRRFYEMMVFNQLKILCKVLHTIIGVPTSVILRFSWNASILSVCNRTKKFTATINLESL